MSTPSSSQCREKWSRYFISENLPRSLGSPENPTYLLKQWTASSQIDRTHLGEFQYVRTRLWTSTETHSIDWTRISQWSRSFITYSVVRKIQSGECLEKELHRCGCVMKADCWSHLVDLERIRPVLSPLHQLSGCHLILQSGECLKEVMQRRGMGDGSRLLISPGWSWANRLVILLLHHLSRCCSRWRMLSV